MKQIARKSRQPATAHGRDGADLNSYDGDSLAPLKDGAKAAPMAKTRILLVEDHEVVRDGLSRIINQETDLEVCGVAATASDGLKKIGELKPDLLVTDISMKGMNGIEFLKHLKAEHPALPAIVLSMHDEETYAERALRAGALAFVMKTESSAEVMTAIRKARQGEYHVSNRIGAGIFQRFLHAKRPNESPIKQLSDRELEVFELLGRGHGSKEIAEELHLSAKTVDTHRTHIKEKLQLRSFTELIQRATQWVSRQSEQD